MNTIKRIAKHLLSKRDEEDTTFPEPYTYATDIMLKEALGPVKQPHCCEEGYEEWIVIKPDGVNFNTAVEFECDHCKKHCTGWMVAAERWTLKPNKKNLHEFALPLRICFDCFEKDFSERAENPKYEQCKGIDVSEVFHPHAARRHMAGAFYELLNNDRTVSRCNAWVEKRPSLLVKRARQEEEVDTCKKAKSE